MTHVASRASLYTRPQLREFSKGDRVQFTTPVPEHRVANREQGTIQGLDPGGKVRVHLDSDRRVTLEASTSRHIDYGYAVTSYSSQGLTARRVLVHADTSQSKQLINERYAYVAISRGSHDARVYTDNVSPALPCAGPRAFEDGSSGGIEAPWRTESVQPFRSHDNRGRSIVR